MASVIRIELAQGAKCYSENLDNLFLNISHLAIFLFDKV